jgi:DNA modification methylase/Fe-S-cluster containining protein
VADKFVFPPFSVLDAKQGAWQDRKRAWGHIGIKGEVGRDAPSIHCPVKSETSSLKDADYVSIFDPVLCELVYRWFCPPHGQIIDPFAGGSVRGIVASMLGFKYWGCDLRQEQIDANNQQSSDILGDTVEITISSKMMNQMFMPCTTDFILKTCKGRCCEGSGGIMVTIHKSERKKFHSGQFLAADSRGLCPYKSDNGLCSIHKDKPFGCLASPFTLNNNDKLIVRNRYRCLKCYRMDGNKIPAYEAHRLALVSIVGQAEYARLVKHLKDGGGDLVIEIKRSIYEMIKDNDDAKNGTSPRINNRPIWVCGDSKTKMIDAPDADFIFSCPPYGDLEKYSDDPNDLSAMDHYAFTAAYKRIILKSVSKLKENSFACFVVGDFRDKKGFYRNFVSETINGFEQAGARLYNEAILLTSIGSASMRVTKQFNAGRKLVKVHQNVLVFCKGDGKKAARKIDQI